MARRRRVKVKAKAKVKRSPNTKARNSLIENVVTFKAKTTKK